MIEVNCNLCGRNDYTVRFPSTLDNGQGLDTRAFLCTSSGYGKHAQVVECRHCGHVYASPRWKMDKILSAYGDVEDETYAQEREGRELTFQKHLHHMEQYTGPAQGRSLLDVGAYIGVFVEIAQKAGWQTLGIEPSRWAVTIAQEQNLPVIEGTLSASVLQDKQFDVITMWDVIEHVTDPKLELQRAYQRTKASGWIVVHTMDIDSITARLMGARWPWLMSMHIHYFSQATLTQLLKQVGYNVVWSGARGRYLRLGYLSSRLAGINTQLGHLSHKVINTLGAQTTAVPVNFGDLFTVYARKPS